MIIADHENLLDAMLVQQRQHFFLGCILTDGDQAFLGRHHRRYRGVQFGFEPQIAMRDDADDFGPDHHRHSGNILGARQLDDLPDGHVRFDGDRIADDSAFEFLDAIDLPGLIPDGHVLVDDADAAFLCDGDGETGFGDGVHRGGDHREVDADFAGQSARKRDFARQYF